MSKHYVHMLGLDEIVPYQNNPRNNDAAVDAVVASIVQFGFRVPLVVDRDNVLICGHTRLRAVKAIVERDPTRAEEFAELPCFRADDLSPEQVNAFRLVDNKTSELAEWDFDLLANEVSMLGDAGIDLTGFGWTREEIDCLQSVVAEDCLNPQSWDQGGGDGVSQAVSGSRELGASADGSSVRITVGTFGFMVLREDYERWFETVMGDKSFDYERANDEVASRLGLKAAKDARAAHLMKFVKGAEAPAYAAPEVKAAEQVSVTI